MSDGWPMRIRRLDPVRRTGRVQSIHATHLEADGPSVPLGSLCEIAARMPNGPSHIAAEVIRIDRESITLAPLEEGPTFAAGALVTAIATPHEVPAGPSFLGRVVDPLGRPLDGRPAGTALDFATLFGEPPAPLDRRSPRRRLETGIRAIDGLLPLGEGQRVGVFAAAGVGKTSLLIQFARQLKSDILVIALIGERGREVEALWQDLPVAIRKRTILVAATSDQTATMRVRAAHYAMAQAEYWRARGLHVALLLDSVTRLAMALREIGLAAGEPPTVRAYTPNVFAALPRLVERAGALAAGGAISMIMTVLSEGDDVDDPIVETMKSLLDGHFILSRTLAEEGHFPALDILRSVSRQAPQLQSPEQVKLGRHVSQLLSAFEQSRMAREAGLYAAGSDALIDQAVQSRKLVMAFLQQGPREQSSLVDTDRSLATLMMTGAAHAPA